MGALVPRPVVLSMLGGAVLGALGGWAAIIGRGAVELGATRLEGLAGIVAVAALLALMGLMLGLILMLIMRSLRAAATQDRRK
ncbi:hypothetical protein OEG84_03265 [Hoeflea sp. G2-23]|uniref:Major facilitator superfamily (MFS) profile domain-containing protein n=1 Tax=Hoeflea algicola TaxID=2983763 RepID=A0ABT3Z4X1_9HYPH|nr:hypothetical protein [Hoeflea algicola]MCY0146761.1 hypothetical protein [Hoeflea algicola]